VKSSLVLMAAGLGSRFGGTKQLAPVGKSGEALLDYTIQDAKEAGIEDVVVITRSEIAESMQSHLQRQHPADVNFKFVLQDLHGPPRVKPWGTTHAVISATEVISGSFILANADDYYGPSSIQIASEELAKVNEGSGSLITFELSKTLSSSGPVTRGICSVENYQLVDVTETEGLFLDLPTDQIKCMDNNTFAPDTPVSMNLWCFHPSILESLQNLWKQFVSENQNSETAECLLPVCISNLMDLHQYRVATVPSMEEWSGLTNPDDLDLVKEKINSLRG